MVDNSEFVKSIQNATLQIINKEVGNMKMACLLLEGAAKKNCPVDTGVTRASISSNVAVNTTAIVGTIGSNSEIAPYIHNGTGIYAKDGNGRKTPWGYVVKSGKYEGFHITRGQKPKPFLEDAKIANRGRIERILGGS